MKRYFSQAAMGLLALLVLLGAYACDSESNNPADGDGPVETDGDGGECVTHDDCLDGVSNKVCNSFSKCIDRGTCSSNEQCTEWYGGSRNVCGEDGLCTPGSADGDETPTDGDSTPTDGDTDPIIDPNKCETYNGLYDGAFACGGSTTHKDTYIYVDPKECKITFKYDDESIKGTIDGLTITTDSGKTCTGNAQVNGTITLVCGESCTITFKPKTVTNAEGYIKVTPSAIRFGGATVGIQQTAEIEVSNLGTGPLTIREIFFTSSTNATEDEFTFSGKPELPKTIESSANLRFEVVYDPKVEEPREGGMIVSSDAMNKPVIFVKIQSTVKSQPFIEVEPTALSFGSSPPDFDNRKYFLIKSTGGTTACLKEVVLEDDQTGAFIMEDGPAAGTCLDSSKAQAVTINFHPKTGVHAQNSNLVGKAKVVWLNVNQQEQTIFIDLLGKVKPLEPACIDIQPLGGTVGFGGLGEYPGPGVNYGYSQIQAPRTEQVVITNCGDQPLTLSNFIWQNAMFDSPPMEARAFNQAPGSFVNYTLQRHETIFIDMTFLPRQEGILYASAFKFMTNATKYMWYPAGKKPDSTLPITVGVRGIGARRGVEVLPSKMDFGLITLECCSRPEQFTVYNIGDLVLNIKDVTIGAGSDIKFELKDVPPMPYALGGTGNPQSFAFETKFCPSKEGPHTGRVEVQSDDANQGLFVIPLKGEGTLLTHQKDSFTQPTHPMVDVLWVIDCSGSMGEEQDNIANNFGLFIEQAVTWNADLHVAVVSCDIVDASMSGKFQGSPAFLYNRGPGAMTNDEIISNFKSRVRLGTNCDGGQEAGLEAAHAATAPPLSLNENKDFMRDDAKLALIWLSDEEDQSTPEVSYYIDYFRSLKGPRNVNMIEGYAIVGDKSGGCTSENGDAASGQRYIAVADACNSHDDKHFMSICETDFEPVYENLAENLFALRNQFFLSRLADPATIVVTIDGVTDTSWTYDGDSNSIIFDEANPPGPGKVITAEYDTVCLQ